jgi:carbamoyl-phosphate synthase small subunit
MAGEVVFNTGMVGYPESLTDPSYCGQILVLTYPLVGNYGVPAGGVDDLGLPKHFESDRIQVAGLVVATLSQDYSHHAAVRSLHEWLAEEGVPGLTGVDTRHVTKRLRARGVMPGRFVDDDGTVDFEDPNQRELAGEVCSAKARVYNEGAGPRIAVICPTTWTRWPWSPWPSWRGTARGTRRCTPPPWTRCEPPWSLTSP